MHRANSSIGPTLRFITAFGVPLVAFAGVATAQIGWISRPNFVDVPDDPADSRILMTRTSGDQYNFRDSHTGDVIEMADPTIQWIDGYYYITGTDADSQLGNFRIYRTRDFHRFDFFRYAFNENNRVGRLLLVSPGDDGKIIGNLQSPQLYLDPENATKVFLVFTATVGELGSPTDDPTYANVQTVPTWDPDHWHHRLDGLPDYPYDYVNPLFPWDSRYTYVVEDLETIWADVPPTSETTHDEQWREINFESTNYESVYVASMDISDFTGDPESSFFLNAPDSLVFYGYDNSGHKYDGGATLGDGREVPASAFPYFLYDFGSQTMPAPYFYQPDFPDPPRHPPHGVGHRTSGGDPYSQRTAMVDGEFTFFDELDSNQPWSLYDWQKIGWSTNVMTEEAQRGIHIAGAKLRASTSGTNDRHWRFLDDSDDTETGTSLRPFAFMSNDDPDHQILSVDNGFVDVLGGMNPAHWAVTEGPAVAYDSSSGRECYHITYSRNTWDSPAYCVMSRPFTPAGAQTFADAALADWDDGSTPETLLVSSRFYDEGEESGYDDYRHVSYGRSYGGAEIFFMLDHNGDRIVEDGHYLPYIIFHAKVDGSTQRTLFFKELTYKVIVPPASPPANSFEPLLEAHPTAALDTWRFRAPLFAAADFNHDGFCNGDDYDDFVSLFEDGWFATDFDENGFVNGDDFDAFSLVYENGCL